MQQVAELQTASESAAMCLYVARLSEGTLSRPKTCIAVSADHGRQNFQGCFATPVVASTLLSNAPWPEAIGDSKSS